MCWVYKIRLADGGDGKGFWRRCQGFGRRNMSLIHTRDNCRGAADEMCKHVGGAAGAAVGVFGVAVGGNYAKARSHVALCWCVSFAD